jgi:hypothetical protein
MATLSLRGMKIIPVAMKNIAGMSGKKLFCATCTVNVHVFAFFYFLFAEDTL